MNILFTSSDPGSSQQNNALATGLKKSGFKIGYITTKRNELFYNENYNKRNLIDDKIVEENDLINFIDEFNPDFIITGLSVEKKNIDYTICKIAKNLNIKSGCIQDYYGYIGNYDFDVAPDYIFVFDDYAKGLTARTNLFNRNNIIITGSPKHERYHDKIYTWFKNLRSIKYNNKEIIVFLQPLNIPGVMENMNYLCDEIINSRPKYTINVKPHPQDSESPRLEKFLDKYPFKIIGNKYCNEVLLLYYKNIFSCYSTIAYDAYYLFNKVINSKINKINNILIGQNIYKTIKKLNFDIKETPQYKMGINIINKRDLSNAVNIVFSRNNEIPNIELSKVKQYKKNSIENIIKIIKK